MFETPPQIAFICKVGAHASGEPSEKKAPPLHTPSSRPVLVARSAASPIYPNGTRLLLWNVRTKAAAEVRVTNSGPFHGARRLDVSRGAAERLGFRPSGIGQLSVTVLSAPTAAEAQYLKGRTYAPVAGYLGVFESAAHAHLAAASGASGPRPAKAATALPNPVHTGSVGWDTKTQPVRQPLTRQVAPAQVSTATPQQKVAASVPSPKFATTFRELESELRRQKGH